MATFQEDLERRTEQFRQYLELMRHRRRELTKGDCFLRFEERLDTDDPNVDPLTESKALVCEAVHEGVVGDEGIGSSAFDEIVVIDLPIEGWRGDDSNSRFIQFSFNARYFDMDIPNTTLYRAEAEVILRDRPGFFYLLDHREFEFPEENAEHFNPLRKAFVYGDDRLAAEDMAYVWFHVWKFPVDWRFYVTAAAFVQKTTWEQGFPIE
jgi:hypothetical protein